MSNDDTPTTPPEGDEPDGIKQLRATAARAGVLAKENAFLKAGVDPTTKMGQRLFDSYKGELTAEAIKLEAEDWGITQPTPPEQPTPPDPSAGQQQMRQQLQSGQAAGRVDPPPQDLRKRIWDERKTDLANGVPTETANLALIDKVIASAASGDPTFLHDPQSWSQSANAAGHDSRPESRRG